jgi:hypothetical protein
VDEAARGLGGAAENFRAFVKGGSTKESYTPRARRPMMWAGPYSMGRMSTALDSIRNGEHTEKYIMARQVMTWCKESEGELCVLRDEPYGGEHWKPQEDMGHTGHVLQEA